MILDLKQRHASKVFDSPRNGNTDIGRNFYIQLVFASPTDRSIDNYRIGARNHEFIGELFARHPAQHGRTVTVTKVVLCDVTLDQPRRIFIPPDSLSDSRGFNSAAYNEHVLNRRFSGTQDPP